MIATRLVRKFGTIDKPTELAIFDFANKGITAGDTLTRQVAHIGTVLDGLPALIDVTRSRDLVRFLRQASSTTARDPASITGREALTSAIPFDVLPLMSDLFGDNPDAARALVVTHQSAVKGGKPARLDIQLAGGETWEEFIERAISWRDYIADYDPYRFDDMDEQEIITLSIQVVAGWRKW